MVIFVVVISGDFVLHYIVRCFFYFVHLCTFTTFCNVCAHDAFIYHLVIHLDIAEYVQQEKEREKR